MRITDIIKAIIKRIIELRNASSDDASSFSFEVYNYTFVLQPQNDDPPWLQFMLLLCHLYSHAALLPKEINKFEFISNFLSLDRQTYRNSGLNKNDYIKFLTETKDRMATIDTELKKLPPELSEEFHAVTFILQQFHKLDKDKLIKYPGIFSLKVFYYLTNAIKFSEEEAIHFIKKYPSKVPCLALAINPQNLSKNHLDEKYIEAVKKASHEACYVLVYLIKKRLDRNNVAQLYDQIFKRAEQLGYIEFVAQFEHRLKILQHRNQTATNPVADNVLMIDAVKFILINDPNTQTASLESKSSTTTSTTSAVTSSESKDVKEAKETKSFTAPSESKRSTIHTEHKDGKEVKETKSTLALSSSSPHTDDAYRIGKVLFELIAEEYRWHRATQGHFLKLASERLTIFKTRKTAQTSNMTTQTALLEDEDKRSSSSKFYHRYYDLSGDTILNILNEHTPTGFLAQLSDKEHLYKNQDLIKLYTFTNKCSRKTLTLEELLEFLGILEELSQPSTFKALGKNAQSCLTKLRTFIEDICYSLTIKKIITAIHRTAAIIDKNHTLNETQKIDLLAEVSQHSEETLSYLTLLLTPTVLNNFGVYRHKIRFLFQNQGPSSVLKYLGYLQPLTQDAIDALCVYQPIVRFEDHLKTNPNANPHKLAPLLSRFCISLFKQGIDIVCAHGFISTILKLNLLLDPKEIHVISYLQKNPKIIFFFERLYKIHKNSDYFLRFVTENSEIIANPTYFQSLITLSQSEKISDEEFISYINAAAKNPQLFDPNMVCCFENKFFAPWLPREREITVEDLYLACGLFILELNDCTAKYRQVISLDPLHAPVLAICLVNLRDAANRERIAPDEKRDAATLRTEQERTDFENQLFLLEQKSHLAELAELFTIFSCQWKDLKTNTVTGPILPFAIPSWIKDDCEAIPTLLRVARKEHFKTLDEFLQHVRATYHTTLIASEWCPVNSISRLVARFLTPLLDSEKAVGKVEKDQKPGLDPFSDEARWLKQYGENGDLSQPVPAPGQGLTNQPSVQGLDQPPVLTPR